MLPLPPVCRTIIANNDKVHGHWYYKGTREAAAATTCTYGGLDGSNLEITRGDTNEGAARGTDLLCKRDHPALPKLVLVGVRVRHLGAGCGGCGCIPRPRPARSQFCTHETAALTHQRQPLVVCARIMLAARGVALPWVIRVVTQAKARVVPEQAPRLIANIPNARRAASGVSGRQPRTTCWW